MRHWTLLGEAPIPGADKSLLLYQGKDDFKFAGLDVSLNKLVMGHRDASGWVVDVQTPIQAKPETNYNLLLALNGTTATLVGQVPLG